MAADVPCAAMVPPEVDLRDFPYMPLRDVLLRDSRLASVATGDEFRAAVLLPDSGWDQAPAEHREAAPVLVRTNGRDILARCDVVARAKVHSRPDQA